jgi:hypothetical protein
MRLDAEHEPSAAPIAAKLARHRNTRRQTEHQGGSYVRRDVRNSPIRNAARLRNGLHNGASRAFQFGPLEIVNSLGPQREAN